MRNPIAAFLLFIVIVLTTPTAQAGNPPSKRFYNTQQLQGAPPVIDGFLTDDAWQQGEWSGNYTQQTPNEGAAPSQPTELKILFDDKNVYVAIKAYDSDKKIDARRGKRDNFYGDIVGVCFDSYLDYRTGFEFDISAGGAKIDLILLNADIDLSWNAVWDGKTQVGDSIWTAEMRIPLSQLRFGKKDDQVWGLHAWRWINRNFEESQWNPIPRNNAGALYHIGELHGISGLKRNRRFELMPYVAGQSVHKKVSAQNPFIDGNDQHANIGIDGKLGIASNFTLDFTVNPDFGQVEADPAELNLTVFETYFDEKRPFFLEGRNIFDFTGFNLFYSRRIGHEPSIDTDYDSDSGFADTPNHTTILGAVKLTGKTNNGLSVGVLESLTQREQADIWEEGDTRRQTVEPLTNYLVARVQKDMNKGNSMVGAMATSTNRNLNGIDELARNGMTGGVDFFHHWHDKKYFAKGSIVGSTINGEHAALIGYQERSSRYYQRIGASYLGVDSTLNHLDGLGSTFHIGKTSQGKWSYSTGYDYRTPGLELNDLGFLTSTDQLLWNTQLHYKQTVPKHFYLEYGLNYTSNINWTTGGEFTESDQYLSFYMRLKNKWFVKAQSGRVTRGVDTRLLRGGPAVNIDNLWCNSVYFETDGSKTVTASMHYHFHLFDDHTSYINDYNPELSVKAAQSLNLSAGLSYSNSRDMLFYITTFDNPWGKNYLLGEQTRQTMGVSLRADWAITPELTLQYYCNPYISSSHVQHYKMVNNPMANSYTGLTNPIAPTYNSSNQTYSVNYQGHDYEFDLPGFSYQEIRSNFVCRWEFRPGSNLYFVWTHNRSDYSNALNPKLGDGWGNLGTISPQNVFMLKLSYWLSI